MDIEVQSLSRYYQIDQGTHQGTDAVLNDYNRQWLQPNLPGKG